MMPFAVHSSRIRRGYWGPPGGIRLRPCAIRPMPAHRRNEPYQGSCPGRSGGQAPARVLDIIALIVSTPAWRHARAAAAVHGTGRRCRADHHRARPGGDLRDQRGAGPDAADVVGPGVHRRPVRPPAAAARGRRRPRVQRRPLGPRPRQPPLGAALPLPGAVPAARAAQRVDSGEGAAGRAARRARLLVRADPLEPGLHRRRDRACPCCRSLAPSSSGGSSATPSSPARPASQAATGTARSARAEPSTVRTIRATISPPPWRDRDPRPSTGRTGPTARGLGGAATPPCRPVGGSARGQWECSADTALLCPIDGARWPEEPAAARTTGRSEAQPARAGPPETGAESALRIRRLGVEQGRPAGVAAPRARPRRRWARAGRPRRPRELAAQAPDNRARRGPSGSSAGSSCRPDRPASRSSRASPPSGTAP